MFKKHILIALISTSSLFGCAFVPSEHDQEIAYYRKEYRKQCEQWDETKGQEMVTRKEGEERLSVAQVINKRCLETPDACLPPSKPKELIDLEYSWGRDPVTKDYCREWIGYNPHKNREFCRKNKNLCLY